MKLPPSLLYVRVKEDARHGFGLWLPLFLLWPLIVVILAPVFLCTIVADAGLAAARRSYHHYTRFLGAVLLATFEIRNLKVHVRSPKAHVNITII